MDSILVTSYVNPDLDGYACAFAYAELLNKTGVDAKAGISGTPLAEVSWIVSTFGIPELTSINPEQYDRLVLVDTSDTMGIDPRIVTKQVVEIIDHRSLHRADKFSNAKIQIELVGACATLIAERFAKMHITPTKEAAILLHGAILSNTINFKNSVSTQRDIDALKYVHEYSHLPQEFTSELFSAKSDLVGDKLLSAINADYATGTYGGKKIGIAQLEIIGTEELLKKRFAEIMHITNALKSEEGLDYCFLSIIDAECGYNTFVTNDSQDLLSNILQIEFTKHIARTSRVFMRKEIWPLLKNNLES